MIVSLRAKLSCGLALFGTTTFFIARSETQTIGQGPSFSCARAPEGGAEEMICRDRDLSRQDRVMATAYSRVRALVRGSEGLGELMASQQWAWCLDHPVHHRVCAVVNLSSTVPIPANEGKLVHMTGQANATATFGNVIPLVASIIGGGIGLIAFGLGSGLSLIVIAIAWFTFRPLLSLGLLVAAGAAIYFFRSDQNASRATAPA